MPDFVQKIEESNWQKASAGLDASAKIYAYRVDSVHNEIYKILGGLSRNENRENDEIESNNESAMKKKNQRNKANADNLHLELNKEKLDTEEYDVEFAIDPFFKHTTTKFNDNTAKNSLLGNLMVDRNLDLILESQENELNKENEVKIDRHNAPFTPMYLDSTGLDLNLENLISDFRDKNEDLKSMFTSSMTLLCPNLEFFKSTGKVRENSMVTDSNFLNHELKHEQSFYNNFIKEIEENKPPSQIDIKINQSIEEDGYLNIDAENEELEDIQSVNISQNISSNISLIENQDFDDRNLSQNNLLINSGILNPSMIKPDEIIGIAQKFGNGTYIDINTVNINNNLPFLDKRRALLTEVNDKKPKKKKEEKRFNFSSEEIVSFEEVFNKFEKKPKKIKILSKEFKKKKIKEFFNFNPNFLRCLFTTPEILVGNMYYHAENGEAEVENLADDDQDFRYNPEEENVNQDFENREEENQHKSNDNARFARLYKTYDVKKIKQNMWEILSCNKGENADGNEGFFNDKLSFSDLRKEINMKIESSNAIDFVCLLHLSNEKSTLN